MIFRLKHRWQVAAIVTVLVALVGWPLGAWQSLPPGDVGLAWQVAYGLAAAAGAIAVDGLLHYTQLFLRGETYRREFLAFGGVVLGPMRWPEYLTGGAMAALAEEPLFRGLLLPLILSATSSSVAAVLVTALIFAACHSIAWKYWPFWLWGMWEGIAFGILYLVTGSLIAPMIAHGLHDVIGYRVFQYEIRDARK